MPEQDELDRLLDSALATYADRGPDAGLEERVLSALASERQSGDIRRAAPWLRRWLPWVIAVPLAASLMLWIGIEQFRHAPSIQQQQVSQSRPSTSTHGSQPEKSHAASDGGARPASEGRDVSRAANAVVGPVLKGHDFSRAANVAKSLRALAPEGRISKTTPVENPAPIPKLAVFPSPQPLTREEQVLVAAAGRGSDTQREALLAASKPPSDAPLAIADLSIPPLVAPDEGNK